MNHFSKVLVTTGLLICMLQGAVLAESEYNLAPEAKGDMKVYPLRSAAQTFGYQVTWDAVKREISLTNGSRTVIVSPASGAVKEGQTYGLLGNAIYMNNGATYLTVEGLEMLFNVSSVVESNGTKYTVRNPAPGMTALQLLEATNKNDLTLRIMRNSLSKSDEVVKNAETSAGNVLNLLPYYGNGEVENAVSTAWQGVLNSRIQNELTEKGIINQNDILKLQVESQYDALQAMINSQTVLVEAEKLAQITMTQAELKHANGLISEIDLGKSKSAYDTAKANASVNAAKIMEAKQTLSSLSGVPVDQLILSEKNVLVPLKNFNPESVYADAKANSYVLFSLDQSRMMAKYGLDYYVFNVNGGTPYKAKEYDLANAELEIEKEMQREHKVILNTWQQIIQAEEQNANLLVTYAQAQKELDALKLQKDLGMVTDLQLRTALLGLKQIELQIEANVVKHRALMRIIYKPWLSS